MCIHMIVMWCGGCGCGCGGGGGGGGSSSSIHQIQTDTCKTNNSIKHIWQAAREALVLSQLATYS